MKLNLLILLAFLPGTIFAQVHMSVDRMVELSFHGGRNQEIKEKSQGLSTKTNLYSGAMFLIKTDKSKDPAFMERLNIHLAKIHYRGLQERLRGEMTILHDLHEKSLKCAESNPGKEYDCNSASFEQEFSCSDAEAQAIMAAIKDRENFQSTTTKLVLSEEELNFEGVNLQAVIDNMKLDEVVSRHPFSQWSTKDNKDNKIFGNNHVFTERGLSSVSFPGKEHMTRNILCAQTQETKKNGKVLKDEVSCKVKIGQNLATWNN